MTASITTAPKRAKLERRNNPYWVGLSGGRGGVSLGYRKPMKGPGSWVAKVVQDGKRLQSVLGTADDDGATPDAIPYRDAVTRALEWAVQQEAAISAALAGEAEQKMTVRAAIEEYAKTRAKRSRRSTDAEKRLTLHVLSDQKFSDLPLAKLTAKALHDWRGRLDAKQLAPSTVNRLFNDVRAALNAAVERHGRMLPVHIAADIKTGLRGLPDAEVARKQILSDADVRRMIDAAFVVDKDGDFGRLVLVLAATGARFSQVAAMTVADFQADALRLMVPAAAKGKTVKAKPRIAVPVGQDVIDQLEPAIKGRRGHEPLLMRWHKEQVGPFKWDRIERRTWSAAAYMARYWKQAIATAELPPDAIPYALRHSSIVRALRAGVPVRMVAALHDTSTSMIEKHYSSYILDATEEIARRAVVSLVPAQPTKLQVVK